MMPIRVTCFALLLTAWYPVIIAYRILFLNFASLSFLTLTGYLLGGLCYAFLLRLIVIPYFTSPLRHLPGPPKVAFAWGHGPQMFSPPIAPTFLEWMRAVPNHGLILARGFFHIGQVVLVTTPEAIIEVLNVHAYDYEKPGPARKFLSRFLGNGLIIAEGKEHKFQRKAVAAAFQGKHIKELVPLFWAKATHFIEKISAELSAVDDSKARQGVIEIGLFTGRCTLDIIGKAGFNRDFNTLDNSDDELATQFETITNPDKGLLILYFAINMLLPPWLVALIPWKMNQRITAAMLSVRRICGKMVAERKAQVAEENKNESIDILSVLLKSSGMSDKTLVDECLTFLAAGHETTSSAVTWASYLLSENPGIQERLRTELRSAIPLTAFQAGNTTVDAALMDSLPLLHGVCNETLRLFPTVPLTSRSALRNTTILDHTIPPGTEVILCPWAINRLEALWGPDADEFKPDRWIGGDKATTLGGAENYYAFLTFLHGPRSCIGQGFARLEMKCLLAALVLKFRLEQKNPGEVPVPGGAITIKPKGGMWLRLTEI